MIEQHQSTNRPEQTLLGRAQAGEREAFDQLFSEHKDAVYGCLWHMLDFDVDATEDAVGNVFLNAFQGIKRFRGGSSFSTWLYRIAINEAHSQRRQRAKRKLASVPLEEAAEATGEGPADRLFRDMEEKEVQTAVRALPEPFRTPVVLRYWGGLDTGEVAAVLGRPAGTVRYQLSRAIEMLRERWEGKWTRDIR